MNIKIFVILNKHGYYVAQNSRIYSKENSEKGVKFLPKMFATLSSAKTFLTTHLKGTKAFIKNAELNKNIQNKEATLNRADEYFSNILGMDIYEINIDIFDNKTDIKNVFSAVFSNGMK